MGPLLVFIAFVFGFAVTRIGLPPLVGYLAAGFTLNYFGLESFELIELLADFGILLLLFSIGLKLKIKNLLKPEIWGSASLHMALIIAVFGILFFLFGLAGIKGFSGFSWSTSFLLAFALSFSSTVFAVKALEDRGDIDALHGNIAIGVLIIQDIAAVLYLTFSTGKFPSIWALALIPGLFIIRPLLLGVLQRSGHRELLILFGIFVPIGLGASSFELVGLKPDLGALILGALLANSPRAGELADVILNFKDLLLVGFFLNIGLSGLPTISTFFIACFFVLLIATKGALFYGLFTRFKLRARTSFFATLALANYSEFGLLICAIGVKNGILGSEWLVTMALALSLSFLFASPLNSRAHTLYANWCERLKSYETKERLPNDMPIDLGDNSIAIFGMGRIGTRVYDSLAAKGELKIIALDFDADNVAFHQKHGRNVICDDATNSDLWERLTNNNIKTVLLTMTSHRANMLTIERLKEAGFTGTISATARFPDDLEELKKTGVAHAYDLYAEAGQGFADDISSHIA